MCRRPRMINVIQTFASDTTKESFTNRIHQWRVNSCAQYFHPCALCNAIELGSKLAVIIANDELEPFTEWRDVAKLLRGPFRGWGARNANMHNSLRVDIDDEERKYRPKPDIVGLQEIAGPNRMVSQERAPSLAARKVRWSDFRHVSLDCPLRNSNSKLQELAANSFRSPGHVFGGHAVDERDDVWVNS